MKGQVARLLAKYVFVLLSPVLILSVLGYTAVLASRQQARLEMIRIAESDLRELESRVNRILAETAATALAFGSAAPALSMLEERLGSTEVDLEGLQELSLVRDIVSRSAHAREDVQSIYIYLEDLGQVLTSEFGIVRVGQMPDRSWLTEYHRRPTSIVRWVAPRQATLAGQNGPRQPVLSVFQRLFVLDAQELRGVVVLNISEAVLKDQLHSQGVSAGTRYLIADGSGEVILTNVANPREQTQLLDYEEGPIRHGRMGPDDFFINSYSSGETNWRYILAIPEHDFLAPVSRMARTSAIIVTIAVLSGTILAGVMTHRGYRYIREILEVIEKSESDETLPELRDHSTDGFNYLTYHILRAFVERRLYHLQLSERSYREKTLELLALQSQMNPHFLFNALDAINWQIIRETHGAGTASNMLSSLGAILQYALRSPTSFVPLEQDIDNARRYAQLQSLRYHCEYKLEVCLPGELSRAATVPMTTQPLVENSIVHGFRNRSQGHIKLTAEDSGGNLRLTIEDDGCGAEQGIAERVRAQALDATLSWDEHIGIANTVRRLKLAFGVSVDFRVGRSSLGGFKLSLEVPMRFTDRVESDVNREARM